MNGVVDLLTPRLRLRRLTRDDEASVMAYRGDAHASRFLGHPPLSDGQYASWFEERDREWELREPGHRRFYGIEVRASAALVGDAVLILSADGEQGEIGMFLHPDTAGLGYSLEAGTALLDVGFGSLGLHRIIGRAAAHNHGSGRAMERMGLRREAVFLQSEKRGETWIDSAVYAVLAEEWERKRHPSKPAG